MVLDRIKNKKQSKYKATPKIRQMLRKAKVWIEEWKSEINKLQAKREGHRKNPSFC